MNNSAHIGLRYIAPLPGAAISIPSSTRQHQRNPKAQGRGEGEDDGGPGHWDIPIGHSFLRC
jgi:hypothetical protein